MAEIAVLVIFVLLLVLGTLFAQQARELDALRMQITELREASEELHRLAETVGRDPQKIIDELARSAELEKRLIIAEKDAERLRKLEKEIGAAQPEGAPKQPLPEFIRELVLVRDAVVKGGLTAKPDAIRKALTEARAAKEAMETLAGKDLTAVVSENEQLTREVENLKAQMANLRRQAQKGGRGLDHPPCWATPDGRAEYIFDIALTSQGLVIRDRDLPHRAQDRAALPLSGIVFGEELLPDRFLAMTGPLYQWSVDHECRFVVRAFDTTGATEKANYKRHMRVLEQRFYKYEEPSERF
jgi:cell division protein FtsB